MDKATRNAIERATQRARKLLEADFAEQLEGTYDVLASGTVAEFGGPHLTARQRLLRDKIVAAIEHKRAARMTPPEAVKDYLRDAAFTTLNRFVALKMLEARDLVQECITKGEQSAGFREFCLGAPGVELLPHRAGYRLYIESLFDELSTEVKVLFDRRDSASVLWPKRSTFETLLEILNGSELREVWGEDETIGWVYQYFNSGEERRAMRDASQAPRNSRELAVRNQFFTPRYVVQFLTDNTLGRIWYEMRQGATRLVEQCEYMVRRPEDKYAPRPKKDPRDLRVLDPACGSGHFLLYAFELLLVIYEEGWGDAAAPRSEATGRTLRDDYPTFEELRRELPGLILRHNLHGVDIDPRCAQIAQLALWMRAQRVFRHFGVARAERPLIRRANIVIAEPMPGEADLRAEFSDRLADPALAAHFENLVDRMKLAGEMGLLLRVEELVQPTAPKGENLKLFATPAEGLRSALASFADEAAATQQARRRLFHDDAAQGLGLVEIAEKGFDVVLMNPPFGEMSPAVQAVVDANYSEARNDIYAAFVRRGGLLVAEAKGYVGAITSRAFVTGRDHRHFRRALLQADRVSLDLFADLGGGVLDGAMVETAAYVLGPEQNEVILFLDARGVPKRTTRSWLGLAKAFQWPRSRFTALPQADLLYDLDNESIEKLTKIGSTFEPAIGRVTFGLTTKDDFRFVRLRWEVSPESVEPNKWAPFSKGGEYSWFTADTHLVVNQWRNGAELAAFAELRDGNVASTRRSSMYYFKPAVCFSRRSQKGFSARRIRRSACFSDKSGVIIPLEGDSAWLFALPAVLASTEYQHLIAAQSKFGSYEIGPIKRLPVPDSHVLAESELWASIYEAFDTMECADETAEWFYVPPLPGWSPAALCDDAVNKLRSGLAACGLTADEKVVEHIRALAHQKEMNCGSALLWISWGVGVAFGRFDARASDGNYASFPRSGPFAPAPSRSPGMMSNDSSARDILVDDKGHTDDLMTNVMPFLQQVYDRLPENLHTWLATEFFSYHLQMYSKSRRQAPIYWQLATPSASYSVWLYTHAFTSDTLYKMQEIVETKLRHEETKLESQRSDLGPNPKAAERKILAARETFVDELRTFLEEVKLVAPLWNPDLDDGVIINFALLWRLVPHQKPWQKELKATWDALSAGEYDWAHMAMHLWPECVVPKCATDRSLAIAHRVEEVFWEEGHDGKWKPKPVPTRAIEELVQERTSQAVKAALKSLLEAPVAGAAVGRGRPRRKRQGPGDEV